MREREGKGTYNLALLPAMEPCDDGELMCDTPLAVCLVLDVGVVGVVSSSTLFPYKDNVRCVDMWRCECEVCSVWVCAVCWCEEL